jgi:histidyl-tRNA synthetase
MKKANREKQIKKSKEKKNKDQSAQLEKKSRQYSLLRGMHDLLPKDEKYTRPMYESAKDLASHFQFGRIETPILEEVGLFVRSIGRGTDVVDKEMYVFEDKDGTKVCLRPEMTAAVVRAYIMHGFWNMPQPSKFWYWGSMFRHDRPQAGRYREFRQVGFETFGSVDPHVDAELILVAYNFFKDIKLPVKIQINSIGTQQERVDYKAELVNYYRSKRAYLCEECKARIARNPMRLLDCKEEQCKPIKDEAPNIINWLGHDSKGHFMKVLEYLDELGISYELTPTLVRGLNYYTNTVFEVFPDFGEPGSQSALGGGGRYDLLVEEMGGKPTPAAGMAIGIERTMSAWKQYNEESKIEMKKQPVEVFVAQLGEEARKVALKIVDELRGSGLRIGFNFTKASLKNQMELADGYKTPYTIIIGQKEVQDKTVIVRDMESGIQETVDQKKVAATLKRKLEKI